MTEVRDLEVHLYPNSLDNTVVLSWGGVVDGKEVYDREIVWSDTPTPALEVVCGLVQRIVARALTGQYLNKKKAQDD